MHIKIIRQGRRVFVPAFIVSKDLGEQAYPIKFLADTGADVTTISEKDAIKIGVDFTKLKKDPEVIVGVGGRPDVYLINDVIFRFEVNPADKPLYAKLNQIDVVKPPTDEKKISPAPSLLGTDLLNDFKFNYNKRSTLEF